MMQSPLLTRLREEKAARVSGGIYHKIQLDLTYNSNHIEGSRLTHDQTRYIYETNTILPESDAVRVDDIIETANHFRCIDLIIDEALAPLTPALIKTLHRILKSSTADARKDYFAVGEYKRIPNEVGGRETTPPEQVEGEMNALLATYEAKGEKTFADLLAFHHAFESIHPFQDGNGRVGRLILFKECLRHAITPFIITDDLKLFYYRGLAQWQTEPGYLTDTCLTAKDRFDVILRYFRVSE